MVYHYYALLESDEEDGGYCVTFPDFGYIFTQGEDIDESLFNAKEALELAILTSEDDGDELPKESDFKTLVKELKENQSIHLIKVDTDFIRIVESKKRVNMTVKLPQGLIKLGKEKKVNFSRLLEEKLKEELEIA